MSFDKVFNIAGLIVGAAIVTILVSHKETANVIKALGNAFSGSIKVAQGRG